MTERNLDYLDGLQVKIGRRHIDGWTDVEFRMKPTCSAGHEWWTLTHCHGSPTGPAKALGLLKPLPWFDTRSHWQSYCCGICGYETREAPGPLVDGR